MKRVTSRTNLSEKECHVLAMECAEKNVPYLNHSEPLHMANSDEVLYKYADGKLYTADDLKNAYYEICLKDVRAGFRDRIAGYYDKWYRYNRMDEGAAYDKGVRFAVDNYDVDEMHIIECNQ